MEFQQNNKHDHGGIQMMGKQVTMRHTERMAILAKATLDELELAWDCLPAFPCVEDLSEPDVRLLSARSKAPGSFCQNTPVHVFVTHAAVRLATGETGFSRIFDDDKRRAWLAAVFDAIAQQRGPLYDVALSLISVVGQRVTEEQAAASFHDISVYGLRKHA